jgi:hypothetical protein
MDRRSGSACCQRRSLSSERRQAKEPRSRERRKSGHDRRHARADVRWMNLDSDVKVDGAKVGTVHIDPVVYGLAVGCRF